MLYCNLLQMTLLCLSVIHAYMFPLTNFSVLAYTIQVIYISILRYTKYTNHFGNLVLCSIIKLIMLACWTFWILQSDDKMSLRYLTYTCKFETNSKTYLKMMVISKKIIKCINRSIMYRTTIHKKVSQILSKCTAHNQVQ